MLAADEGAERTKDSHWGLPQDDHFQGAEKDYEGHTQKAEYEEGLMWPSKTS